MIKPSTYSNLVFSTSQLLAAIGIGILLGSLSVLLSPIWVLVGLAGILGFVLVISKPELGVMAAILLTSTILSDAVVPRIPIGFGHLYISDVLLLLLFGIILFRFITDHHYQLTRSPLSLPLVLFVGWSIFTTIRALIFPADQGTSLELSGNFFYQNAISELRTLIYYLYFFAIINLFHDKKYIHFLVNGMYFLGTIVIISMLYQYLVGTSLPFLPGRVETLITQGQTEKAVTRIADTLGEGLVTTIFILKSVMLFTNRFRTKNFLDFVQWLLFGIGLILTFNRTHWLLAGLMIIITVMLERGLERYRIIKWGIIFSLIVPMIILPILLNPKSSTLSIFVKASWDRLVSATNLDVLKPDSAETLRWRDFEYLYAIPQIEQHPIFGLGMGARYRPIVTAIDHENFDGRAWMHNGHLWLATKSGLVGYFFFLTFSAIFIWRGFMYWRKIPDPYLRSIYLGFTLVYTTAFLGAFLHTIITIMYWTVLLGVMMGINEIILKNYARECDSPAEEINAGEARP